jgi:hypothetical protein
MAWGSTYTASGTWTATAGGGIASATFNVGLPSAPSGGNGWVSVLTTSGQPPTGAVTAITSALAVVTGTVAASSGHVYAMVGHSIIA